MYDKDKEELTNLQSILEYLINTRSLNFEFMCKKLNLDYDIAVAYCEEMFEQGYLSLEKTESGEIWEIEIQPKGKKFLHHGGYTKAFLQQKQDKLRKEELENLQPIELKERSERNNNTERERLQKLIEGNKINEAIDELLSICKKKGHNNHLTTVQTLSRMHTQNKEESRRAVIHNDEKNKQTNHITVSLLGIIDEIFLR